MDSVGGIIFGLYGLGAVVAIIIIISLIVRRIGIKKKETFEKRDN